ncbi:MAG: FAD-dependent oxidoreductase [Rubrivivax sp.]|nr:FAD-dependent oxidoreductase [Rubrivivax sp.]
MNSPTPSGRPAGVPAAAIDDAGGIDCDLLVIGSGAAGLATAITARKAGLDVLVVEKEPLFGGTTAFSGGVMWVPGNPVSRRAGIQDTREAARRYLQSETGEFFDAEAADAFLEHGPAAIEFFERETSVQFVPTLYPDYHPTMPGGVDIGRAILAAPFDIRELGPEMARLRPPLSTITFIGMMFNSSNADLKHFFRATKSFTSALYVAKRLVKHVVELVRYRRGVLVTSGNALAARLAKSAFDLGIPIWTETPATALTVVQGRVVGATVQRQGQPVAVQARRGVVLASGGFAHDVARLKRAYPHVARGGEHCSPVPSGNTGDGARLAESVGGTVPIRFPNAAAWMPVSKVPFKDGRTGVFPHLLDRYKPGVIGVLRNGERFCNETESYHDVGDAMIKACAALGEGQGGSRETAMWLVCDAKAMAKYGLGYVKPAPMPHGRFVKNGYLFKGDTLEALARSAGIDPAGLARTVTRFNEDAVHGEDHQFERGRTSFNRYLADPEVKPNPCVAPLAQGPFFAIKLVMGDLGTFDGIRTSAVGEVLRDDGGAIPGLYAAGNDRASMMGGNYPGAGITLGPHLVFGHLLGRHVAGLADASAAGPGHASPAAVPELRRAA